MLPYYFQIPLGAILAIVDPVVIGIVEKPEVIVEKPEVIAVSKLKVVLRSLLESQLC